VGDAARAPIAQHADGLGTDGRRALAVLGDDDVGDVVADRVALVVGDRAAELAEPGQPAHGALAERADVVDRVGGEQLVEPVQLAVVDQVPVQGGDPRYRRAKLPTPTDAGRRALADMAREHERWVAGTADELTRSTCPASPTACSPCGTSSPGPRGRPTDLPAESPSS
jgi:hypothetical protein